MMSEQIGTKNDEQHPLLKVDSGGGDSTTRSQQSSPSVITSGCNGNRGNKHSWMDRWPEFVSACWITFILIGISFLTFYTLAMNAYRRQQISTPIFKYNDSNQANTVHYHQIIPRGSYISFLIYSDYISNMAMQYPSLYMNVIFLMDDSIHGSRHSSLVNKLIPPSYNVIIDSTFDQSNKREIRNVQKKFPNVNITIMSLSKYMALTPLRYRWRTIPIYYLNFYVRILAVWHDGGIAMDLVSYNNIFNMHQRLDRRISAILKLHNDGIEKEEYAKILKKINEQEQNEVFAMLHSLMYNVLKETSSFFNRSLWYSYEDSSQNLSLDKPLLQMQRSQRDNHERYENESDLYHEAIGVGLKITAIPVIEMISKNTEHIHMNLSSFANSSNDTYNSTTINVERRNETSNTEKSMILFNVTKQPIAGLDKVLNYSSVQVDIPQYVFFYDFSALSDNSEPKSNLSKPDMNFVRISENLNLVEHSFGPLPVLSISSDGTFVAASLRQHPLLGHIISSRCQGINPAFVVERAVASQCSSVLSSDLYCDNIYVL